MAIMAILYGCIDPEQTEEEIMESNAQIIVSKLPDITIGQARGVALRLNEVGVGKIKTIARKDSSDKRDRSFTLTDSNGASYYVAMNVSSYIYYITRDNVDGEMLYHEQIDSSFTEEDIEYMREESRKRDIKETNMRLLAARLFVDPEETKEAAELFGELEIGKILIMDREDSAVEGQYCFTLINKEASFYVVMEEPAHVISIAKDTADGEVIYHD
jgi:hypothetical protein